MSTFLLRASSIIFFPIFSLYLTERDYGILSITQSLALIITVIGGMGITRSMTRFLYFEAEKIKNNHSSIIYTSLFSSLSFQLLIVFLIIVFNKYIPDVVLNDIPFFPYVFVAVITIPLNTFIEVVRTYFKSIQAGKKVFLLDIFFFSFNILFNLFYVVILGFDVVGIFYGILTNTIIFCVILYFVFYRKFKFNFNWNLLTKVLRYCAPLVPYAILNICFEACDKLYLNSEFGASYSGIYYIVIVFAAVFSAFKEAINTALTPWVYSHIKSNTKIIRLVVNWTFLLSGFLAITLSFLSKEILTILSSNPTFIKAHIYIPFTLVSFYLILFGNFFNIKTYYFGRYTDYLFIATIIGLAAELIACYFLIPKYDILGATISRLIAFAVHVFVLFYFSYKEVDKREMYDYKFLFLCCIIMSCLISLPFFIDLGFSIIINILIKLGFIFSLVSIVYVLKRNEVNVFIKSFVNSIIKKGSKKDEVIKT